MAQDDGSGRKAVSEPSQFRFGASLPRLLMGEVRSYLLTEQLRQELLPNQVRPPLEPRAPHPGQLRLQLELPAPQPARASPRLRSRRQTTRRTGIARA